MRSLAREGSGRRLHRVARPDLSTDQGGGEQITLKLTEAQVREVIRRAEQGGTASTLLSAVRSPDWTLASEDEAYPKLLKDKTMSHLLLTGLLVLSCFPMDGEYMGVGDVARMLGRDTSTAHRYMRTLLAVGLLERNAVSRKYRIAEIR